MRLGVESVGSIPNGSIRTVPPLQHHPPASSSMRIPSTPNSPHSTEARVGRLGMARAEHIDVGKLPWHPLPPSTPPGPLSKFDDTEAETTKSPTWGGGQRRRWGGGDQLLLAHPAQPLSACCITHLDSSELGVLPNRDRLIRIRIRIVPVICHFIRSESDQGSTHPTSVVGDVVPRRPDRTTAGRHCRKAEVLNTNSQDQLGSDQSQLKLNQDRRHLFSTEMTAASPKNTPIEVAISD